MALAAAVTACARLVLRSRCGAQLQTPLLIACQAAEAVVEGVDTKQRGGELPECVRRVCCIACKSEVGLRQIQHDIQAMPHAMADQS